MKLRTLDRIGVLVGAVVLATAVGVHFGALEQTDEQPGSMRFKQLTAYERYFHTVYTEPTRRITLEFATPAQINAATNNQAYAYSVDMEDHCRIIMPTGQPIQFDSAHADAWFASDEEAHAFAHEILHCLRWDWHGKNP